MWRAGKISFSLPGVGAGGLFEGSPAEVRSSPPANVHRQEIPPSPRRRRQPASEWRQSSSLNLDSRPFFLYPPPSLPSPPPAAFLFPSAPMEACPSALSHAASSDQKQDMTEPPALQLVRPGQRPSRSAALLAPSKHTHTRSIMGWSLIPHSRETDPNWSRVQECRGLQPVSGQGPSRRVRRTLWGSRTPC